MNWRRTPPRLPGRKMRPSSEPSDGSTRRVPHSFARDARPARDTAPRAPRRMESLRSCGNGLREEERHYPGRQYYNCSLSKRLWKEERWGAGRKFPNVRQTRQTCFKNRARHRVYVCSLALSAMLDSRHYQAIQSPLQHSESQPRPLADRSDQPQGAPTYRHFLLASDRTLPR